MPTPFIGQHSNGKSPMIRLGARLRTAFLVAGVFLAACAPRSATAQMIFTSSNSITISNGVAASAPYPSVIYIGTNGAASLPGTIQKVSVILNGLSCQALRDLACMLVAPNGSAYEFMSRVGTSNVVNLNLTFDDNASSVAPTNALTAGSYKPSSYSCGASNTFVSPAPQVFSSAAICGTTTLTGEFGNLIPDGAWELFIDNQLLGPGGSLNSWSLNLSINPPDLSIACKPIGPFCQGQSAQYSLTISNAGPGQTGGSVPAMVVDTLPTGLTPMAASGPGWNCVISNQTVTCMQTNIIAAGTAYPVISLTVNVASGTPTNVINTATVSGSSDNTTSNNTVLTPTTVNPLSALIILPPATPCPGSTGNIATGPVGAASYSWSIANGIITSGTNSRGITYEAGPSGLVGLTLVVFNAAGCSATNSVIVGDIIPPTITCSSNITVTASGYCPVVVNFNVSASDNCTVSSVVATPPSGSAFPVGTNIVNVVATDTAGNTNTCSFKVTVLPGSPPQLLANLAGTNVVLSWPAAAGCYALQYASALPSASNLWTAYAGPLATNAGRVMATNNIQVGSRFYRLAY
jgi:hypothetical protein